MHGMGSRNASFSYSCFRTGAAPAVVLALLCFAKLESRSTTLDTRATALGCAAEALNFSARIQKIVIH
jgi:hypothetical protein